MSAQLKELESAEASERMTDEELCERERMRWKHPPEPVEPLESEFHADLYSCPDRLYR